MRYAFLIAEAFSSFTDELGEFKAHLYEVTKGMLYLYEASYLSIEGENVLEHARDFTTKHLEEFVKRNKDEYLSIIVDDAEMFTSEVHDPYARTTGA